MPHAHTRNAETCRIERNWVVQDTQYCDWQQAKCGKTGTVAKDQHGKRIRVIPLRTADYSYTKTNGPVVRLRLQQAGLRLAWLLEQALAN